MYACSACETDFRPEEAIRAGSETQFNMFCPECGAGVIPDGDGEELRRQREVQRQILTELREITEETETPDIEGESYPIERLKDDLEQLLADIESELERRSD